MMLPTIETMAPLVGAVTTATLVNTPPSCAVISMATWVLNAAVTGGGDVAVGGAGVTTVIDTVATPDGPPGPVA